jgi:5-formyltetrahydrofolate cyclo-ligase
MQSEASVIAKHTLRRAAKAVRSHLSESRRRAGAERLAAQGLDWLGLPAPATVSAFRSFGDELDTGPLLARLAADGYRLALPVMQGKSKPLLFRAWAPGDPMRTVQWGIEEPLTTAPEIVPDILLVPLLAFDRQGFRLGYGGGYYDRTLAQLRACRPVVAVGLAFSEQEVDAVPHLDYDERLDWVLTPSGPVRCHS